MNRCITARCALSYVNVGLRLIKTRPWMLLRAGLLANFNAVVMKAGIRRIVR